MILKFILIIIVGFKLYDQDVQSSKWGECINY